MSELMDSVPNVDIYKFLELDQNSALKLEEEQKCNDHLLLKMLEEGIHTDITLVAQGGSVKAHRSVLASASPVFCAMFQHNMKEQLTSTVEIPDMTIDGLRLFLLVLYTINEYTTVGHGIATVPMAQLFSSAIDKHFGEFWEAVLKYQVLRHKLRDVVLSALVRNLSPDNCWLFYDTSLQVDGQNGSLTTSCHKYMLGNYEKVITSESLLVEMGRNPERVQGFLISAMSPATRGAALDSFHRAKIY